MNFLKRLGSAPDSDERPKISKKVGQKMAKNGKADEINKKKIQKKTAKGAHISPLMANFCDLRFPPPLPDVTPPGESLDKGGGGVERTPLGETRNDSLCSGSPATKLDPGRPKILAKPKSPMRTSAVSTSAVVQRRLSGFRSRWAMPLSPSEPLRCQCSGSGFFGHPLCLGGGKSFDLAVQF